MKGHTMTHTRFLATIAVSTVAMFAMMYLNTWDLSHVRFSQTRAWTLYMGGGMAIVMLVAMWGMVANRRANVAVLAGWPLSLAWASRWCAVR